MHATQSPCINVIKISKGLHVAKSHGESSLLIFPDQLAISHAVDSCLLLETLPWLPGAHPPLACFYFTGCSFLVSFVGSPSFSEYLKHWSVSGISPWTSSLFVYTLLVSELWLPSVCPPLSQSYLQPGSRA